MREGVGGAEEEEQVGVRTFSVLRICVSVRCLAALILTD